MARVALDVDDTKVQGESKSEPSWLDSVISAVKNGAKKVVNSYATASRNAYGANSGPSGTTSYGMPVFYGRDDERRNTGGNGGNSGGQNPPRRILNNPPKPPVRKPRKTYKPPVEPPYKPPVEPPSKPPVRQPTQEPDSVSYRYVPYVNPYGVDDIIAWGARNGKKFDRRIAAGILEEVNQAYKHADDRSKGGRITPSSADSNDINQDIWWGSQPVTEMQKQIFNQKADSANIARGYTQAIHVSRTPNSFSPVKSNGGFSGEVKYKQVPVTNATTRSERFKRVQ